jgi:hypothetical protein
LSDVERQWLLQNGKPDEQAGVYVGLDAPTARLPRLIIGASRLPTSVVRLLGSAVSIKPMGGRTILIGGFRPRSPTIKKPSVCSKHANSEK